MHVPTPANLDASELRLGVAVSEYHREITQSLCDAAVSVFRAAGGKDENLTIVPAPGAFELTAVCRALAFRESRGGRSALDAIVALGCILSGQTTHDQYIAQSVTQGLTALIIETGLPIGFGVLTCQTMEQARARSAARPSGRAGAGCQ